MDINASDVLMQLRKAARLAPRAAPEAAEPPVCTLFERCSGCPYPAHGFNCWGPDGGCLRRSMRKIQGIEEEHEK